jgi:glycosyltransferase involved in cell wall biosynthesis
LASYSRGAFLNTLQAMGRAAAKPADVARHGYRSLPEPARARIRAAAVWADQRRPAPPIEGWSGPLIQVTGNVRDAAGSAPARSGLVRATAAVGGLAVVAPAPADGGRPVAQPSANSAEPPPALPRRPADPANPSRPAQADPLLETGEPTQATPLPDGMSRDDEPVLRCLVVTGLLDVGGMDEVVAFLARRLPGRRMHTAVLHATSDPSATGEPSGRLGQMLRSAGIEVREAGEQGASAWIQHWRPDVITAHGAPDWVLGIAERLGIPCVDNLHGMHTHFWADWRAEAARSARLSAFVSVSELVRDQYLAGNPSFPAGRIVTIPNGVDDQRRAAGDRAAARSRLGLAGEYLFVSLARYCLQKNTYGLLTAFAEVARQHGDAHLVVAGRPDDIRYYRRVLRLRDGLPGADRIHLRDHVTAPAELLAAADGFVLDSFFEGWSLASMEALFAGVPVVLSEVGGAREQIAGDRARGHVVTNPLGDPLQVNWAAAGQARYQPQVNRDELAAAMGDLIASREDYLANRGRLAAESAARFSADSCLDQHAEVLRAVAANLAVPA